MTVYEYMKNINNRSINVVDKVTDILKNKFKLKNVWNQSIYNIISFQKENKEYDITIKELIDNVCNCN